MERGFFAKGLLTGCLAALATVAYGWSAYDGFDYRSALLDGADGGSGEWSIYWRPSGAGGVKVISPGLTYTDRAGQSLAVTGNAVTVSDMATAGAYRDTSVLAVPAQGKLTVWLSCLAKVEGGPFDASGDEASLQLRDSANTEWVTLGVMGRLDQWRLRLGNGKDKFFSDGAKMAAPAELHWLVVCIQIDTAPGGKDSVSLWIDPAVGRQPHPSEALASVADQDIWQAGAEATFSRMRVGLINSGQAESKTMTFDEVHLGESFAGVAPVGP
jgi:hypothetical protein